MLEDEIIQVLMLKESAIQNATKFFQVQTRRAGSTGFKSSGNTMSDPESLYHCSALRTIGEHELCAGEARL